MKQGREGSASCLAVHVSHASVQSFRSNFSHMYVRLA
jgi:hypothetical protein